MEKKAPKEYRVGQHVRVKLSGGRIEEATVAAVIPREHDVRLQIDFGRDETALIGGRYDRYEITGLRV